DSVKVKVINVDDTGRIKLSRRALMDPPADGEGDGDSRGGGGRRGGGRAEAPA
ncbi:MAG TPA: RNA-binding protein S1, partial [Phycisphaerales bacterium]|nr:RNA-binding protein S1 [Phycisphaerales bacterium]